MGCRARGDAAPEIRPLYNQVGLKAADAVVLVEGEKCAAALVDLGICATTAMNGAKAPIDKTDWSPLKGKRVIIWPDHDEARAESMPVMPPVPPRALGRYRLRYSKSRLISPPNGMPPMRWPKGWTSQAILKNWERMVAKEIPRRAKPCRFTALPTCSGITARCRMI
jgi:hypothetical protein